MNELNVNTAAVERLDRLQLPKAPSCALSGSP